MTTSNTIRQSTSNGSKDIRFGTYNIQSGRNGRLETCLRAMQQMELDWGILTETKLTNGIHTRFSSDYNVFAMDATNSSQGGVAVFFRESETFQIESLRRHGPNVLSFELVTGGRRHPVVGVYIPPSDTELNTLEYFLKVVDAWPNGREPLILGDLNADLRSPRTEWSASISTEILSRGYEDLLSQFRPRRQDKSYTWHQRRHDRWITSRCDYILGLGRGRITQVAIREPRLFASDHLMVLGRMTTEPLSRCTAYAQERRRMPLRPPTRGPLTQADTLFQTVLDNATAARTPSPGRQPWISQATWTLIDQRIAIRRAEPFDQAEYRRTSRRIKQSLAADRKKRVEQAGADIEGYLSAPEPDLKAAWGALQAWYRHAGDRPHR